MRNLRSLLWPLLAALALAGAAGCAQDVGDIDRTQPDKLEKADFDGVWYYRQTMIDVPATTPMGFVGIASNMEKIRWEITADTLYAYRSYERVPGVDEKAGDPTGGQTPYEEGHGEGTDPDAYKEAPIAAFPITSHFDIQRQYNSSTGEQTNVIVENTSDRPWYERDYMRVNWAANAIVPSYPAFIAYLSDAARYVSEGEEGNPNLAWHTERDGRGDLSYFDFVTKLAIDGDELKVRSSFMKLEDLERDYEPAFYTDEDMTKFGYFRTERVTYDRNRGYTDTGVIYLANRHDMWKNDFKRGPNGEYLRDADGRRIPTAMADREPKPVVYYVSENYPERMMPGTEAVASDWDKAFTRAAAAAKGMDVATFSAQYGPMFVLCHNPVAADDHAACDPRPADQRDEPFVARRGDLRYSFIDWVAQPQMAGPLGYGPSYPDPETGELISGTAYVYGAAVDTYAESSLEIVRFMNGDIDRDDVFGDADYVREYILENLNPSIDPRGESLEQLEQIDGLHAHEHLLSERVQGILGDVKERGLRHMEVSPTYVEQRIDKMKEAGLDKTLITTEMVRAVLGKDATPAELSDTEVDEILANYNPLELDVRHRERERRLAEYARDTVYLAEFADPAIIQTAISMRGRTDYDQMRTEIANRIFHGVMAHEVGHTIGLRHNFQGSYDSVNYFDEYWEQRKENFELPSSLADFYESSALTDAQAEGGMLNYAYSSIMDYHSRFNGDWQGVGKYDDAAILYAYTFGTYDDLDETNTEPITAKKGFVEVFTDIQETADLPIFQGSIDVHGFLHGYDDRYAASQHPLEDLHYTTLITMMGGPDRLTSRELMHYEELLAMQEAGQEDRPVEVQYMFCSDEWVGATMSCDRWDLGSDPFEVVKHAIARYKAYYPFTHFRRDRLTFNSFSGASAASRSFNKMPQVYQRWFFDQYYGVDPILSNYYLFAAFSGFNLLGEVLSMPEYGGYNYDAGSNTYRQATRSTNCVEGQDADVCVRPGNGRRLYSRYDYGSGYYYFTRTEESGHYWDAIMAMSAMTTSVATAVGVDQQGDMLSYLLPYYLVFEDELTGLFNGMIQDKTTGFSPTFSEDGQMRFRPSATLGLQGGGRLNPLTGEVIQSTSLSSDEAPVDLSQAWIQRRYSLIYGLAFFNSSYSQHFIDQARIYKLGHGEQLAPDPDGSFVQVSFTDPSTGVTYAALVPTGTTPGSSDLSLAAEMVFEGQRLTEAMAQGDQNAEYYLSSLVEDINRVIGAVDVLGMSRF